MVKEDGNLYCLDDISQVEIFGSENADFGRINILLLPCNFGYEPGVQPPDNPDCELSREAQMEFLKPLNFMVLYNSERINQT